MNVNIEGRLGSWQRELENYTVGLVIAVIQSGRAKRLERRKLQQGAPGQLRRGEGMSATPSRVALSSS
jgi:hypothetical protein